MIKKIALTTTLLTSLAYAEIEHQGVFVGVDIALKHSNLDYDNTNNATTSAIETNDYSSFNSKGIGSFKLGYQYYFTRFYARFNQFKYEDRTKSKYSIKGNLYEMNLEYLPILYRAKNREWNIRAAFGLGFGYATSKMNSYSSQLLPVGESADKGENYMQYGYQTALLCESDLGLSAEIGLRYREGHLFEFSDGQNEATITHDDMEYYLGINYLF